jgi:optic atrophy 3 protein
MIKLGNTTNYYNTLINRKIFGMIKETSTIKPLTDDKALERGAELISEIIVYTILLTIPIYEMMKSYKSNVSKEKKKKEYLFKMQTDVEELIEGNILRGHSISELNRALVRINENIFKV